LPDKVEVIPVELTVARFQLDVVSVVPSKIDMFVKAFDKSGLLPSEADGTV
jgi:hypothetical protein